MDKRQVKLTGEYWKSRGLHGQIVTLHYYDPDKREGLFYDKREGLFYVDNEVLLVDLSAAGNDWGGALLDTGADPSKGEVRTTSSTGGEKGVKPEAYALIPWEAMDEIARVYAFGAEKYAAHNWRKGYEWSKSFSSLCRHIFAWWRGEDLDPESGLSHLGHAGFHVLGLLTWCLDRKRYGEFDDRYRPNPD